VHCMCVIVFVYGNFTLCETACLSRSHQCADGVEMERHHYHIISTKK
jgi:hypothetical protein